MLTVALLALFTLLCVLLSSDRAWDNETQPERNALVFDGRNRAYGAFVLRREYERRFAWAFAGAIGLFAMGIAVPKALGALGIWSVPSGLPLPPIVTEWDMENPFEPPKKDDPQTSSPERRAALPVASTPTNPEILVVDEDSTLKTTPLLSDTAAPGPTLPIADGGGGPMPPGGVPGGVPGTDLGTNKVWELPEVEEYPEFIGGHGAMMRFIQDNIRFPEGDDSRYKAYIEFVVDPDGHVVSVRLKKKGRAAFDEAAERVVRAMPKWKPARLKDGREVPCLLVLPIEFQTR